MREAAETNAPEAEPIYDWTRTDDGVRIHDPENPDAWVQMSFEAGVPPEKRLFMVCDDCGAVAAQRTRPGTISICGECDASFELE
jgi:hypothetical protein